MPIVVGFTGLSSGGKTTLVNKCKELLEENGYTVEVVSEAARTVLSKHGWTIDDVRTKERFFDFQMEVLMEQISQENIARSKDVDVVLTDRTVYDNVFYMIYYNHLIDSSAEYLMTYLEMLMKHILINDYDILIVHNYTTKEHDGVRGSDAFTNIKLFSHMAYDIVLFSLANETIYIGQEFDIEYIAHRIINKIMEQM